MDKVQKKQETVKSTPPQKTTPPKRASPKVNFETPPKRYRLRYSEPGHDNRFSPKDMPPLNLNTTAPLCTDGTPNALAETSAKKAEISKATPTKKVTRAAEVIIEHSNLENAIRLRSAVTPKVIKNTGHGRKPAQEKSALDESQRAFINFTKETAKNFGILDVDQNKLVVASMDWLVNSFYW